MVYSIIIACLVAYFLGNLNGAVCISALMHDDVRSHGSGNAGLTNFIRNYGAGKGLLVFFIDAGKAVLGCLNAGLLLQPYGLTQEGMMLGGTCVLLGHVFPLLLGLKGGKGILSGWFVAWVVDWRVGLLLIAVFAAVYVCTHYVSLASVLSAVAFIAGMILWHLDNPFIAICGSITGLLTIFMHRGNIARLLKGEERKTNLFAKGNAK